ncbi:inorganic pyrophosphatase-like isoform X2 [Tachypleus tridentatus]|uniref:inorganic pyrophosphatase-like isoform X2 n=1 Tax=Tachypleus tridentatus TaxID=6853 RepID=UPI003FD09007
MWALRYAALLFLRTNGCKTKSYISTNILCVFARYNNIRHKMPYSVVERGCQNSFEYRVYFRNENGPISPFHDIPIFAEKKNKVYNMVVEIPRWTNAKTEINTKEPLNPIYQDVLKGKLRFVANCFPYHGYLCNYGAIPQTWENPYEVDTSTGCKGDNDPIDVCEIGYKVASLGQVLQIKVLGTLALIDEGKTDWKIIAIDINDPLADKLNDVEDVDKHMPGFLQEFAEKVIAEAYHYWQDLIQNKVDKGRLSCSTVCLNDSPYKINIEEAENFIKQSHESGPAMPYNQTVNKWHFIQLK